MLQVVGDAIVDSNGRKTVLKGAGLGGHLNMENFATGYPGHEHEHRASLASVIGQPKANYFFRRFLYHIFTESDAQFLASVGLNCIRLPFNHRHFMNSQGQYDISREAFHWLDRIVRICSMSNLYVILDLHSVPGGHHEHPQTLFWESKEIQDQVINLWIKVATHFRFDPVIAGYKLLNEPASAEHVQSLEWYTRAVKAIREVDPDHILYVEGNIDALRSSHFTRQNMLSNVIFSYQDDFDMHYHLRAQGPYTGTDTQKLRYRQHLQCEIESAREHNVPLWDCKVELDYVDPNIDKLADSINLARYRLLQEQIRVYAESDVHWSMRLYKDIEHQGLIYVDPASPYMQLVSEFSRKKEWLQTDFYTACSRDTFQEKAHAHAKSKQMTVWDTYDRDYSPLSDFAEQSDSSRQLDCAQQLDIPNQLDFMEQLNPQDQFECEEQLDFEHDLPKSPVSEFLCWEFALLFQGKSEEELDALARSFRFENCRQREGLNRILQQEAKVS